MKERAKNSLKAAVRVTLILTFVDYLSREIFSWSRTGFYLFVAFVVTFILKGWKRDMPIGSKIFTVIVTIVILFGAFFVSIGLNTRSNQILWDYSVSEDGTVITVNPEDDLPSSVGGWVRSMRTDHRGTSIYCYFYNTFGGTLSGLGAKNYFDIKLKENSTKIYFESDSGKSRLVLQKDEETNTWVACDPW